VSDFYFSLVNSFGLDKSLKIQEKDQIKRIIELLNSSDLKNTVFPIKKQNKIIRQDYIRDYSPPLKEFIKNNLIKNIFPVFIFSTMNFLYLTKYSTFIQNSNSLKLFKPLFLFTVCISPTLIISYFSYLDFNNQHKLNKLNK